MDKLKRYTLKGIIFVIITGTISHFVYEWSGNNPFLALFFPVNESTWEHMKLVFFPMLLYSLYMDRALKEEYPCVTSSLLLGMLLGTLSIPVIFYTYTGIWGQNALVFDIATFILSVLLAFAAVYRLSLSCKLESRTSLLRLLVLVMAGCFFFFTVRPPDIPLFISPV